MTGRPDAPACARNRQPILDAISGYLEPGWRLLEIGSGTGQHAVYMARALPGVFWQTSDRAENHAGIEAWLAAEPSPNLLPPLDLDVTTVDWSGLEADAVFTANTCHIMPWSAVEALFEGVASILAPARPFLIYGPFIRDHGYAGAGDRDFDAQLQSRGAGMGLRSLGAIRDLAARHGLVQETEIEMPADNLTLVLRRAA